jgi:Tfp pilus assembly protein PilO
MKAAKQNILIWSILAIVSLLLVGNFILGKQASIDAQAQKVHQRTATVKTQIQSAEIVRSDYAKIKSEIATLQVQVPAAANLSGLISQLASVAATAGVTLVSAAPGTKNNVPANGVTPVPVNISVTGTFNAVQRFTSVLIHATRTTTIASIAYSFGTSSVSAQIQADLYYRS